MNPEIRIGDVALGTGLPKICVSIQEKGLPAVIKEVNRLSALPIDLLEWRMDHFYGNPAQAMPYIIGEKGGLPVIATLRSKEEGGAALLSDTEYAHTISSVLHTNLCECIDLELSRAAVLPPLLTECKQQGIPVILSKHDFAKTPSKTAMLSDLSHMKALGGDILKIAVMPHSIEDVLTLLETTAEAKKRYGTVIMMSMGELGKISRVSGEYFGSCLTFAAGLRESAPGQLPAEELRAILQDIAIRKRIRGVSNER